MPAAILNDVTRCLGCRACLTACREINGLPSGAAEPSLSPTSWSMIEDRGNLHVRRQCMHCLDPACVSVCPVAALQKTPRGPVVYREERCMGCRYCMVACPFGIPRYEWTEPVPRVRKCLMCYETRLEHGRPPACTEVCPAGATVFGERDRLIEEARGRIRAEPGRYVDHIYGETEAGGTSVLYLSSVPFEELRLPFPIRSTPYPRLTWEVLSHLPTVVGVGAATLVGLWWLIARRDAIREAAAKKEDPS